MDILGPDSSDDHLKPGGGPDKPGQDQDPPASSAPEPLGGEDRTSQAPEGKEGVPSADSPPGKSSFGRYQGDPPKLRAGYPCLNCPHSHMDHTMYDRHLCLIEGCGCSGLLIDRKEIPSRMD